jgi:hypothetical protein
VGRAGEESFTFATPLRRMQGVGIYFLVIPQRVSRAIGRRGPVPVIAVVNGAKGAGVGVHASIVPTGGGRHRLQLNARIRAEAGIALGDRVDVVLRVDHDPEVGPPPPDLEEALEESGMTDVFARLPAGRRRHILRWIDEAVADRTREKRIARTVEVALSRAEAARDRAQKR